eukprot:m51a1_g7056 hypothetical protein (212) ;mRNA; r:163873-164871
MWSTVPLQREFALRSSTTRARRTQPFQLSFTARTAWLERTGVTAEDIRSAGRSATVHRVAQLQDSTPLGPCSRCSRASGMPPVVVSGEMGEETACSPDERLFVFYRCVPFCNSSRLHLGGDVVVALTVRRGDAVVARVLSEPIALYSKTSHRPLPGRGGLTWVDLDVASLAQRRAVRAPQAEPRESPQSRDETHQRHKNANTDKPGVCAAL